SDSKERLGSDFRTTGLWMLRPERRTLPPATDRLHRRMGAPGDLRTDEPHRRLAPSRQGESPQTPFIGHDCPRFESRRGDRLVSDHTAAAGRWALRRLGSHIEMEN